MNTAEKIDVLHSISVYHCRNCNSPLFVYSNLVTYEGIVRCYCGNQNKVFIEGLAPIEYDK